VGHERRDQVTLGSGPHEHGGRLEGVEAGVGDLRGRRPDVFHVDAVDLAHLGQEERHQAGVGQLDHQLVDGPVRTPLEDVDADDVAPHRADPAGDLPERAGAVRYPDADDERLHGRKGRGQT
jgi:hypothetical protein